MHCKKKRLVAVRGASSFPPTHPPTYAYTPPTPSKKNQQDYLVAMLLETEDEGDGDGDAYDDEAALEVLQGYLPLTSTGDASSLEDALDVAGLRARLRGIVAGAAAEWERREVEARRLRSRSLSSSLASASRSGGGPSAPGEEETEEEGEGQQQAASSSLAEHAEALAFLQQLVPADAVGPEAVAFAFRVKCLCHRERAADLLLGMVAEGEGALAVLKEEMVRAAFEAMVGRCLLEAIDDDDDTN